MRDTEPTIPDRRDHHWSYDPSKASDCRRAEARKLRAKRHIKAAFGAFVLARHEKPKSIQVLKDKTLAIVKKSERSSAKPRAPKEYAPLPDSLAWMFE